MASPSGQGLFIVSNVNQITNPINGLSWAFVSGNGLFAFNGGVWSSVGSGTITGVTAGLGLTGGGTSGTVTIAMAQAPITQITAGSGLTGGGTSGNVTISLAAQPYYMAFGFSGKPNAGQYMLQTPGQTVTLPANLSTSSANIGTNPTSTAVFTLSQNGTQIATVTISTGGVVTFATTSGLAQILHANDQIKFSAPGSQDTTLADIAITIAGTR